MPGRKDRDHPLASFMTPYVAYRSNITVADAAGVPTITSIDLSTTRTYDAVNNLIFITAQRTSGSTGTLTVELWQNNPGTSLNGQWRKIDEAVLDHLQEKRFENVYGAEYRIRVSAVGSGTWAIHESHSEYEA